MLHYCLMHEHDSLDQDPQCNLSADNIRQQSLSFHSVAAFRQKLPSEQKISAAQLSDCLLGNTFIQ